MAKATRSTDAEKVHAYMENLKHPLKTEIDAVRAIIKNVNIELEERIKWNAPSYHFKNTDLVTFNTRAEKQVHLVFHHPAIVTIKSEILEGDYSGRRMTYFNDMKAVKANKAALESVLKALIKKAVQKNKPVTLLP